MGLRSFIGFLDKAFKHTAQCAAIGHGARRQTLRELRVECAGLSAGRMDAPVRSQVSLADHELALECDLPDEEQEERLARAVGTDDEADTGTTIGDPIDVPDHGLDFALSSDLDMMKTNTRDDAGAQGAENGIAVAGADERCFLAHAEARESTKETEGEVRLGCGRR